MSDQTKTINQAAERYARALYELAQSSGQLDAVAADLADFAKAIGESADLRRLIQSPLYDAETKAGALAALAQAASWSDLTRKFLGVAARNRRARDLEGAARAFLALVAEGKGHLRARVTSAAPLGDAETARLKDSLRAALGRDVALEASVDPSLLAGLRVRVGSRLFDSSLRTKLQGLRNSMKEA